MPLAQKLQKLKEQQAQIEQRIADQTAREDAVALAVFSRFIASQPAAIQAMTNSKHAQNLSKRERSLLNNWVQRIDVKTPANAEPNHDSESDTQTGTITTQKPFVSH